MAEFAHLPRDKYLAGLADIRERYLSQFPEVFDPARKNFHTDPADEEFNPDEDIDPEY